MNLSDTFKIEPSGERALVMSRVFDAPREVVFDAFTKPKLVQQWLLGPEGWTMPVCEIDLRPGGKYRYVWRNADGREMGMGGTFREIVRPEHIIHTEVFDEAWYPGESIIKTSFVEKNGQTAVTTVITYVSTEARDGVLESGMDSGVKVSYDRLDGVLAALE